MALSASIALSQAGSAISTVPRDQKFRATVTVSNSGGSAITLSEIRGRVKNTAELFKDQMASAAIGECLIDSNNPVPAGGSAIYVFDLAFHAPNPVDNLTKASNTYNVTCFVYGNGEIVQPTAATINVTPS